jgi:hypothetical protein
MLPYQSFSYSVYLLFFPAPPQEIQPKNMGLSTGFCMDLSLSSLLLASCLAVIMASMPNIIRAFFTGSVSSWDCLFYLAVAEGQPGDKNMYAPGSTEDTNY